MSHLFRQNLELGVLAGIGKFGVEARPPGSELERRQRMSLPVAAAVVGTIEVPPLVGRPVVPRYLLCCPDWPVEA